MVFNELYTIPLHSEFLERESSFSVIWGTNDTLHSGEWEPSLYPNWITSKPITIMNTKHSSG